MEKTSLISADNTWALLTIMCISVALAIYLEQKYKWASKVTGAIIALVIALCLSNFGIIPTNCTLYDDIIWGFAVPMGIPLLLINCNIKKIWTETGRMLKIFLIGSIGTCVGALLGYFLLKKQVPELAGIAGMMTGSYIGGGVNFAALAGEFGVSSQMVSSTTVADNLLMAIYFLVLIMFAGMKFFLKKYTHPHIDEVNANNVDLNKTKAASYWKKKDISLLDIAMNFAYCVLIVFLAKTISSAIGSVIPTNNMILTMTNTFFGSQYVWITTLSVIAATFCEKQISRLDGSQEIGTYLIYLFLFVIGVPASIPQIIKNTPLLFVFTAIMVSVNMVFCFAYGKIFHYDLEDIILASNANIGGPTTAAGMAISQGWTKLVGPSMLVGTFGYVIGTYLGIIVGTLLGA